MILSSRSGVFDQQHVVAGQVDFEVDGVVAVEVHHDDGASVIVGPVVVEYQPRLIGADVGGIIVKALLDPVFQ